VLIYANSVSPTSFSSNSIMCAITFLLVRAGAQQSRTQSRTLTSSVIRLSERLPSGVQRIRDPEELPRLQSPRAAAPQQQQPDKGEGRAVLRTPGVLGGGQRYHSGTGTIR